MNIELQTELAVRKMEVMYHDVSALLNRSSIKKWLSDLEKIVSKQFPDFIVLRGCSRYILFDIHRKEWAKYYFLSVNYEPNKPVTRSHLVLSRYPFTQNEFFGEYLNNHIVKVKIPFNDVPMRYEYDDLDLQQIDVDTITIVVPNDGGEQDEIIINNVIEGISNSPNSPTLLLFGSENDYNELKNMQQIQYFSEAWDCVEATERYGIYKFDLIQFD